MAMIFDFAEIVRSSLTVTESVLTSLQVQFLKMAMFFDRKSHRNLRCSGFGIHDLNFLLVLTSLKAQFLRMAMSFDRKRRRNRSQLFVESHNFRGWPWFLSESLIFVGWNTVKDGTFDSEHVYNLLTWWFLTKSEKKTIFVRNLLIIFHMKMKLWAQNVNISANS